MTSLDVCSSLPRLAVVTPSHNQGSFLEETIQSVLAQQYQNIEYVIMDGGSTDKSVEIIRRYESHITYWQSQPDGGQYAAINDGFARTSGEIMAWINSDDKYTPWAFSVVGEIFAAFPAIEWLTTLFPLTWDLDGKAVECGKHNGYARHAFLRGRYLAQTSRCPEGMIQQESTFWRRSLWERAGGRIDTSLKLAADFELWARFFELADLYGVSTPLAGFRRHCEQKSARHMGEYIREATSVLRLHGGRPDGRIGSMLVRAGRRIGFHSASKECVSIDGRWHLVSA